MYEKSGNVQAGICTHGRTDRVIKLLSAYLDQKKPLLLLGTHFRDEDAPFVREFAEKGGQIVIEYTNKNGATNLIKNPLWVALNDINSDLLLYERELGLTPAGLKKLNDAAMKQAPKNALSAALEALAK